MGSEAPRGSEERQLALLVAGTVDYAISVLDPDGRVSTWNAGAERLLGYGRDEIVGRHISVVSTELDRDRDLPAKALRRAARDGRHEEYGWRRRKDGTQLWANTVISAMRDDAGGLVGFGHVMRDLTARRLEEEETRARTFELETANRQLGEFQRLVSSVRDYAIFMLDPGGHVLSWNTGAEQLKGYAPGEIIGRHFSVFYTDADRDRDHPAHELELAIADGRYEEEGWRVRRDGTTFWASVTITAIYDDAGTLTGFAKVTRDLTERRAAEEALRQAIEDLRMANAELDRFASVAAHDMTDPLRTISGFAEILAGGELPREQAKQYAGHIRDSSMRLGAMLRSLLAYARAGRDEGRSERVELRPAVDRVLADLAGAISERAARIRVEVPAAATVLANVPDVHVLLQNLTSNAIKFGDPDHPEVTIRAAADGAQWRVTLEDNGPGIGDADRERIFGAFERGASNRPGYGLGLAICQRLAERHGGAIGIEAAPGRGTHAWFALPGPGAER